MVSSCPVGMISRKGYSRKSYMRGGTNVKGVKVKAECILDRGAPGKGPSLIKVRPGGLTKYGYSLKLPLMKRREVLKKAMMTHGLEVPRALQARANLLHRTSPLKSVELKKDAKYAFRLYSSGIGPRYSS